MPDRGAARDAHVPATLVDGPRCFARLAQGHRPIWAGRRRQPLGGISRLRQGRDRRGRPQRDTSTRPPTPYAEKAGAARSFLKDLDSRSITPRCCRLTRRARFITAIALPAARACKAIAPAKRHLANLYPLAPRQHYGEPRV